MSTTDKDDLSKVPLVAAAYPPDPSRVMILVRGVPVIDHATQRPLLFPSTDIKYATNPRTHMGRICQFLKMTLD